MLSSSRQIGFGAVGGIPLSEIKTYIEMQDIEDTDRFVRIIHSMDKAFVTAKPPKK